MVHDAPADPEDFPEDWDDPESELIPETAIDPYDELDEAEQELLDEMREAAEREWLTPQTWYDDGGDGARDQPDG